MPPRNFIRLAMRLLYPARSGRHNSPRADLCIGHIPIPTQPNAEPKTVLLPIVEGPLIDVKKGA